MMRNIRSIILAGALVGAAFSAKSQKKDSVTIYAPGVIEYGNWEVVQSHVTKQYAVSRDAHDPIKEVGRPRYEYVLVNYGTSPKGVSVMIGKGLYGHHTEFRTHTQAVVMQQKIMVAYRAYKRQLSKPKPKT